MHFRAEKGIFSKSSFYSKMFSDPKYSFSVCQQNFFLIQSKIFHQIQPTYSLRNNVCSPCSLSLLSLDQTRLEVCNLYICKSPLPAWWVVSSTGCFIVPTCNRQSVSALYRVINYSGWSAVQGVPLFPRVMGRVWRRYSFITLTLWLMTSPLQFWHQYLIKIQYFDN